MSEVSEQEINSLVEQIRASKKYREAGVSADTIRDILLAELAQHKKPKDALKSARRKLHEVIAPYLGDPDYERAQAEISAAFQTGDAGQVRQILQTLMAIHLSTRERLPLLDHFYSDIFALTGQPKVILDIACALNPLSFPWMNLPDVTFYAYDIHQQRIDFLQHYFTLAGVKGGAIMQDILVHHPQESGDIALLLKETARLEKRQRGVTQPLLDALKVRYIVLSLPAHNRTGRDTQESYRALFNRVISDRPWTVQEIHYESELVFIIDKQATDANV